MTQDPTYLSPPKLARRWGKKPQAVLALIKSGELRALDLRAAGAKVPRWRISPEALAEFEAKRSNTPTVAPTPTRAKPRRAGRRYF